MNPRAKQLYRLIRNLPIDQAARNNLSDIASGALTAERDVGRRSVVHAIRKLSFGGLRELELILLTHQMRYFARLREQLRRSRPSGRREQQGYDLALSFIHDAVDQEARTVKYNLRRGF